MNKTAPTHRPKSQKDALLANIALLYYGQGLTQNEIAKRMQVSRATIVNMLRECREKGIVEIKVDGRHLSTSSLARDLKEKFNLVDAYVALTGDAMEGAADRETCLAQVAHVGALAALDIIEPGDRIGVAWGETIMALSNVLPSSSFEDLEVCQLIGSMISERVPASENCTVQIANKLGADCFTLHAPGIVATAEMASLFRMEPTINAQLKRLEALDMTIASIGNTSVDTHFAAAGMATVAEINAAKEAGAVGIICCRYIDANGAAMPMAPEERIIATEISTLREARKRLLVVSGTDRAAATLAAIRGGLVTHLCVDQGLAEALLA